MARRHIPNSEAHGFNNFPPSFRNTTNDPPDGLTPKYNAAAKYRQPVRKSRSVPISKEQIKELEKKLSRPVHTHEMTPSGNVVGSYDPNRDRKIRHQIKAIQKAFSKRKDMARKAYAKAQLQNKAKSDFNRSSGFRM